MEISSLFSLKAWIAVGVSSVVITLFRERPEKPPCRVAKTQRQNILESIEDVKKNTNFQLLLVAFSMGLGGYYAFNINISSLLGRYGMTERELASLGSIMNLSCAAGKLLVGFVAGRAYSIRQTLIYVFWAMSAGYFIFWMALTFHITWFTLLLGTVLGFFIQMYWAPALEFGSELVYPIGEATVAGWLMTCGCLWGFFLSYLFSWMLLTFPQNGASMVNLIIMISFGFAALSLTKCGDVLKRELAEKLLQEESDKRALEMRNL
jgi:FLVCR family feline leukemia virus subgroup C receptor-related protein